MFIKTYSTVHKRHKQVLKVILQAVVSFITVVNTIQTSSFNILVNSLSLSCSKTAKC